MAVYSNIDDPFIERYRFRLAPDCVPGKILEVSRDHRSTREPDRCAQGGGLGNRQTCFETPRVFQSVHRLDVYADLNSMMHHMMRLESAATSWECVSSSAPQ